MKYCNISRLCENLKSIKYYKFSLDETIKFKIIYDNQQFEVYINGIKSHNISTVDKTVDYIINAKYGYDAVFSDDFNGEKQELTKILESIM